MAIKVIAMVVIVIMMIGVGIPTFMSVITPVTTPTYVSGETIAAANNTVDTVAHYPIDYSLGYPVISNGTVTLVKDQNYTLYGLNAANKSYNGSIKFTQVGPYFGNSSKATISYHYQQPGYTSDVTTQVILQLLPLAFAIVAIVMIFSMLA
jgi:hypothetical protein